jgi:hypothetical protein
MGKELSYRVSNHTQYNGRFLTDVAIQILEPMDCALCEYADKCALDKSETPVTRSTRSTQGTRSFSREVSMELRRR